MSGRRQRLSNGLDITRKRTCVCITSVLDVLAEWCEQYLGLWLLLCSQWPRRQLVASSYSGDVHSMRGGTRKMGSIGVVPRALANRG